MGARAAPICQHILSFVAPGSSVNPKVNTTAAHPVIDKFLHSQPIPEAAVFQLHKILDGGGTFAAL